MSEYFIIANSFAAPIFSDTSHHYETAESPRDALERFADTYKHPAGLYSAACYASSDAYHKGENPLARWTSNHAEALKDATMVRSLGPGDVEINGKRTKIEHPLAGAVRL